MKPPRNCSITGREKYYYGPLHISSCQIIYNKVLDFNGKITMTSSAWVIIASNILHSIWTLIVKSQ